MHIICKNIQNIQSRIFNINMYPSFCNSTNVYTGIYTVLSNCKKKKRELKIVILKRFAASSQVITQLELKHKASKAFESNPYTTTLNQHRINSIASYRYKKEPNESLILKPIHQQNSIEAESLSSFPAISEEARGVVYAEWKITKERSPASAKRLAARLVTWIVNQASSPLTTRIVRASTFRNALSASAASPVDGLLHFLISRTIVQSLCVPAYEY